MKKPNWLKIIVVIMWLPIFGCGTIIDMAEDEEWRWGSFGNTDFVSPIKLRVGVLPFRDEVGLGGPEVGANLAQLMAIELAKDHRILVVPVAEIEKTVAEMGLFLSGDLTPKQVAELGTVLRLNAVVEGSVSEVRQYSQRKGWRLIARLVTDQRQYVDAVMAVKVVDAQTGILLSSRANTGEYDGSSAEKDFFAPGSGLEQPSQEALESSLDGALNEAYHRSLVGLAMLPFKATVVYTGGGVATIAFGEDVGLKPGMEFVQLETVRQITNTIGDTYQVPGAIEARLEVIDVFEDSATLQIKEGLIYPGNIIQAHGQGASGGWLGW